MTEPLDDPYRRLHHLWKAIPTLTKVLAKEFTLDELRFIVTFDFDQIRTEAFEAARSKAKVR